MNIQIYGKQKCFNTKSAQRFFLERKIKYQFIDLAQKGMSPRELDRVIACTKNIDSLFDEKSPLYEKLLVQHLKRTTEDKKQLLLQNPTLIASPIVRDCDSNKCTVGKAENEWKSWK